MDGRIYISFSNYVASQTSRPPHYNEKDEESDEEEVNTLAVLIQKQPGIYVYQDYEEDLNEIQVPTEIEEFPHVLIHLLTNAAVMLERKSSGAAGFDLAVDADCIIEPKGAAWKLGLNVRAGVIDSDYWGEIKIMVFNHSDQLVNIKQEDAQQLHVRIGGDVQHWILPEGQPKECTKWRQLLSVAKSWPMSSFSMRRESEVRAQVISKCSATIGKSADQSCGAQVRQR
ncbi:hypothetical protein ZIOFF_055994 [Zingiber officinale]|uniref:dUTP diphosphatase n=1 Tax=Zingiber officinale TaxID=94328 RepID=A0A8J5FMZ0_ZINOF|nr:hypothetical protein ZIOFF_055994 [Zingiber officinale]